MPAKAGIQFVERYTRQIWTPAFAGVTTEDEARTISRRHSGVGRNPVSAAVSG
jgi:hypothetical protein